MYVVDFFNSRVGLFGIDLTIPLVAGWKLAGFKPKPDHTANENVATYLASITGSYDANNVWVYNNLSGSWFRAGATYSLQPGQAMWVLMVTPATLKP